MNRRRNEGRFIRLALLGLLLATLFLARVSAAEPTGPTTPPPLAVKVIYSYDGAGRLMSAAYEDGGVIGYRYDAGGNLLVREGEGGGYPVYLPLVLRQAS